MFMRFLERVQPDASVREYLQRLAGYSLTGSTREHVLPFAHGGGRNGKGTLFHTLRAALGDYGLSIPAESLMESHHDRHLTELAVLRGARMVVASEIDSGRRWNESRLKRLTGGDPISARFIARDLFEFIPSHTLIVFANNKPGLRQVDEAIKSRMHLIPFAVTIPEAERDTDLPEKLKAEYRGILAWALTGCLDWQARGLQAPETIRAATGKYLTGEDSLAQWLDECTRRRGQVTLKAAHASYREWCESNGQMIPLGRNAFADQLEDRGYTRNRGTTNATTFHGLDLMPATGGFHGD
jgi:putative DNA primase/helicase